MSGTAGNPSATNPSDTSQQQSSETTSSTTTTTKKNDKWSSAKKCTDENGVTYYKGKTGFQSCVNKMKKQEQMGGTSPSDSTSKSTESNTTSHSNSDNPEETPPNQ
jgi:hypothetical protein